MIVKAIQFLGGLNIQEVIDYFPDVLQITTENHVIYHKSPQPPTHRQLHVISWNIPTYHESWEENIEAGDWMVEDEIGVLHLWSDAKYKHEVRRLEESST